MVVMNTETQDQFRARLREHGKFKDFSSRRESFQADGLGAAASWNRAAAEFGFGTGQTTVQPSPVTTWQVTAQLFEGRQSSVHSDFEWVYENQAVEDVQPENAPSSGAWGLLQFSRMEPRAFYTEWLRMASRREDECAEERRFVDDANRKTEEIAEMLRQLTTVATDDGTKVST